MSDVLKSVFLNATPLIDVRAPVEFTEGHFPTSVNLPIMNDEERHKVGKEYRRAGREAAIQLGHKLVSGEIKEQRIEEWKQFCAANPEAKLYCYRGGLRSQIATQWLKEAGVNIERITGGYKALRHFLIDTTEVAAVQKKFYVVTGRTGVGKTQFLKKAAVRAKAIDLETMANHKGSSFGSMGAQPAQATFENHLAIQLLQHQEAPSLIVEDESRAIGSVHLPNSFFKTMREAPIVVLERPLEERISLIIQEYVIEKCKFFQGDVTQTYQFLMDALKRIEKRLGGLNHKKIGALVTEAFAGQIIVADKHRPWVTELLKTYYDPLYDFAIKNKTARIQFKGTESDCLSFLKSTP